MDESTRSTLEFAGVTLSLVAAGLHLVWGVPRFVVYLGLGRMPDPRPPLFVLSAVAVAVAVVALYRGASERPVYAVLIAVMLVYVGGYVAWHLGGHPILGPGGVRSTFHPDGAVTVVVDHLRNDRFALVTTLVEVGAVAALAPLLASRPSGGGR